MNFKKNQIRKIFDDLTSKNFMYSLLGVALLFFVWQIAAMTMHEIMIASPYKTMKALMKMFGDALFWQASAITAQRIFSGVIIGGVVGFLLGLLAGLNKNIEILLEPTKWVVMSVSPVIVVGIAMLIFGMGTQMVVVFSAVLLSPIVYVNTLKGIQMVDDKIIEMANVYKFSLMKKIRHIYIPAIIGPLTAAMTIVISSGVRITILAEVLGTNAGIGYEFSLAKAQMNTPTVFAWLVVTLIFVAILEYLIFKPIENYFLRWKED